MNNICDNCETAIHCAKYGCIPVRIGKPAQQQQEPVAIALNTGTKQGVKWLKNVEHGEPLYTSPPASKPWVGLTDKEIEDAWPFVWREHESVRHFAIYHAIEAKLKEKNT